MHCILACPLLRRFDIHLEHCYEANANEACAGLASDQQLRISHAFSCEIVPFKQSYIERNFRPPLLFRDITELGGDKAYVPINLSPLSMMLSLTAKADRLRFIGIDTR